MMHALEARRRGHEVVHLEREPVPRGASVRNFGLIWVSGRAPGAELELALRARARWAQIAVQVPGTSFRAVPSLTLAAGEAELGLLKEAASLPDAGLRGYELLGPDECRAVNRVCLATGFAPATRDAVIDKLGWRPLIDLALSPADAGRGRPWPDMPLTALLRLGGGAVSELAVVGDTPSDIESGRRAGAGLVAGVLTGRASREELAEAKATVILDSVAGLPSALGLGS